MAKVIFTDDYDYKPTPSCTIAYKAGMAMTVKRDCALKAIAAGKAVAGSYPSKKTGDDNGSDQVSR